MGDGGGGGEKYRSNVAGVGGDLQVSRSYVSDIWDQDMGGDGGHA